MELLDFREDLRLNQLREKMGAEFVEWKAWKWQAKRASSVREKLSTQLGIELDEGLEELEFGEDGTFSYKGEKVLLYIRDQFYSADSDLEYKYHICNCRTVQSMIRQGRRNRYVVTKNTTEQFFVRQMEGGEVVKEGVERMRVCKSCLQNIGYKGYGRHGSPRSQNVYDDFSIDEFFDRYGRSHFPEEPDYTEYTSPVNKYTSNFASVSRRYRESQEWTCEECGLDLSDDKKWLHTHHRNHIRSDNDPSNLKALCLRCHAEKHPRLKGHPETEKFKAKYPFPG